LPFFFNQEGLVLAGLGEAEASFTAQSGGWKKFCLGRLLFWWSCFFWPQSFPPSFEMKKFRFILRLLKAFASKHKKLIITGFFLGIIVFSFFPKIAHLLPKGRGVRKIGIVGRYWMAEIPISIQEKISSGLTKISEDGTPMPALASSWEVNSEAKKYTFHLRGDIFWHDKTKLLAQDVNYNFRDVELEVIDEETISFKLKEPFSPFPSVVSRPIFKKGLVGTGDYRVKKISRTGQFIESISLEAQRKDLPHLRFRFYPTEDAAKTAFKLGEVDILENLLSIGPLSGWPKTKISPNLGKDRYVAAFFNTEDGFLQDKSIRQALAYGVSKRKKPERVLGPLSPSSWAYNSEVKPYEKSVTRARELLEDVFQEREDDKITLTISTVPSLLEEAEKIKAEWEELGFKVTIKGFSPGEDFQILLAIQEIPSDPDQYSLWHSVQEGSITKLKSPRIDKLLEDGRKTQDPDERKKIYYDFQRFLVEEAPAVFLYHPTTYTLSRD